LCHSSCSAAAPDEDEAEDTSVFYSLHSLFFLIHYSLLFFKFHFHLIQLGLQLEYLLLLTLSHHQSGISCTGIHTTVELVLSSLEIRQFDNLTIIKVKGDRTRIVVGMLVVDRKESENDKYACPGVMYTSKNVTAEMTKQEVEHWIVKGIGK
jgi:hypothetical protein